LEIKFGKASIELNGDGIIHIKGISVYIDGVLIPKNGASGVMTLFTIAGVQNGIIVGGNTFVPPTNSYDQEVKEAKEKAKSQIKNNKK